MRKQFASYLGSARASRAGDGASAIANFFADLRLLPVFNGIDCGEAPQSAREARALPRRCRQLLRLGFALYVVTFGACETSNYVPPVTSAMTGTRSRAKQGVNFATLERGRTLFAHRCIECHTLPAIWKYSREDWPQIVNDMSRRASLKTEDRDAVIAYILAARATER